MKKHILMAVAAIAVLSSCDPETNITTGEESGNKAVFTATIAQEGSTRVTLNSNTPEWEANDKISINGTSFTAKTAGAKTTFEGESVEKVGDKYKAYYPANLYNGGTPTLPSTINYTADKFEMPMYAESEDHDLTFKNLCGVFAITVTSADITELKSIRVSSTDHGMSGAFTVRGDSAVLSTNDATKTVVLTCETAMTLDETGTVFYIPLPAQAYKGLKVDLSADGTSYTSSMNAKGEITVLRNQIYDIDYAANHAYVDLGLPSGLLWATCNVGATNPGDYGDYFAWGETATKSNYSWSTLTYCTDDYGESFSKYVANSNYGTVDNKSTLESADDAATVNLGDGWRTPTKAEWQELTNSSNCEWEWTTQDGHNGYKVTSVKNGNSIFLPAAGDRNGASLYSAGSYGLYWSSSLPEDGAGYAAYCYFASNYINANWMNMGRSNGLSVRPVYEASTTPASSPTTGTAKGNDRRHGVRYSLGAALGERPEVRKVQL